MSIGKFTSYYPDYKYRTVRNVDTIDNFYKYIDSLGLRYKRSFVYKGASVSIDKFYTFTYKSGKVFGMAVGEHDKDGMKVTLYTNEGKSH